MNNPVVTLTAEDSVKIHTNTFSSSPHLCVLIDEHEGVGDVVVTKVDHTTPNPALDAALCVVKNLLRFEKGWESREVGVRETRQSSQAWSQYPSSVIPLERGLLTEHFGDAPTRLGTTKSIMAALVEKQPKFQRPNFKNRHMATYHSIPAYLPIYRRNRLRWRVYRKIHHHGDNIQSLRCSYKLVYFAVPRTKDICRI